MTDRDLIHFTVPMTPDRAAREELRAILRTHIALESTATLRNFFVHLFGALGGFIVVCELFPDATSQPVRQMLLSMWALCCLAALTSAAVEWRLRTEEARLLAWNQSADDRVEDHR
jgi:hypothetical protein